MAGNDVILPAPLAPKRRPIEDHRCHAIGCNRTVPPRLFMCSHHWFMLPLDVRNLINAHYRPGQEVSKDPSTDYLKVARAAIRWLKKHEEETAR